MNNKKGIMGVSIRYALIFFSLLFFLTTGVLFSQDLTIPFVFTPGNVISSHEMNQNFTDIATAVNTTGTEIDTLETTISTLTIEAGRWTPRADYPGGGDMSLYLTTGNIGIGTSSPGSLFTVAKNDGVVSGAHILSTFFLGGGVGNNAGVSLGYYANGSNDTGGYIRSEDNLPLMLGTIGTPQALTILDNGNVGIGTTSPSTTLAVNSGTTDTVAWLNSTDARAVIRFDDNTGLATIGTYAGNMEFDEDGNGVDMTIQAGNVGIGTAAPVETLEIKVTGVNAGEYNVTGMKIRNAADTSGKNTGISFGSPSWADGAAIISQDQNVDGRAALVFATRGSIATGLITENMRIYNGNVGIGLTSMNVALDVNGSIEYTGTITGVSDIRLKENIVPIDNALHKIQAISGVYFNMINTPELTEIGVVAQDVQKSLPEVVRVVDPEKGYLGVSYQSIIPVLIEAIKEQQHQIDELRAQLKGGQ